MTTRSTKNLQQPDLIKTRENLKSFIFKIFRANPIFAIFYEQLLISKGYNSRQVKQLVEGYQKKIGAYMPIRRTINCCTHIKVTGVRCGSPSLRGEEFCDFHQRMLRGVKTPPFARLHPIAMLENEESIQASLMEVMNALVRNEVDPKRAELLLRALNAAIRNSRRARFGNQPSEMVREVPDYPLPPRRQGKTMSGSKANPGPAVPDADQAYELTEPKMKMYLDDPPNQKPENTVGVV